MAVFLLHQDTGVCAMLRCRLAVGAHSVEGPGAVLEHRSGAVFAILDWGNTYLVWRCVRRGFCKHVGVVLFDLGAAMHQVTVYLHQARVLGVIGRDPFGIAFGQCLAHVLNRFIRRIGGQCRRGRQYEQRGPCRHGS